MAPTGAPQRRNTLPRLTPLLLLLLPPPVFLHPLYDCPPGIKTFLFRRNTGQQLKEV